MQSRFIQRLREDPDNRIVLRSQVSRAVESTFHTEPQLLTKLVVSKNGTRNLYAPIQVPLCWNAVRI
jgi:hypothetical protein